MRPHRTGRLLGVAALALVLAGTSSACRPDASDAPAPDPAHPAPAAEHAPAGDADHVEGGSGPPVERAENVIVIIGDGMGSPTGN